MELTLPQEIARMDEERLRRYRANLDFYHGRQWVGQARRRERRLTFNYARAIVDKVTSYLMSGLDFAVDPPASTPEGEAQARRTEAALRRVHDENNLDWIDTQFGNRLRPAGWKQSPPSVVRGLRARPLLARPRLRVPAACPGRSEC